VHTAASRDDKSLEEECNNAQTHTRTHTHPVDAGGWSAWLAVERPRPS